MKTPVSEDAVSDPVRSLIDDLSKGARAARETLSGMSQRPWEQLPALVKSAARDDVAASLAAGQKRHDLVAGGYSDHTLEHILRDLGLRG